MPRTLREAILRTTARRIQGGHDQAKSRRGLDRRRLSFEPLEDRRLFSVAPVLHVPDMHPVHPGADNLCGQVIYLDFNGAKGVDYNGPVTVTGLDVPAFQVPQPLTGEEQQIIADVVQQIDAAFAGSGVVFTAVQPNAAARYSTVFVGGNDSAFVEYGSFLGLAEKVDASNQDWSDKAFVFSENLGWSGSDPTGYSNALAQVVAHETAHLLGYAHDRNDDGAGVLGPVAAKKKAEATVMGNGIEIVCGDTTPGTSDGTTFGTVNQGQTGPTRTFTVRNDGNAALTPGSVSLPNGYLLVEGLSTSIAPAGSDTFTVGLDTTTAGTKSGNISFATNDADGGDGIENPYFFAITGIVNGRPTISDVANRTINEDASTGVLAFTVADAETSPAALSIQTSSSNTTIVPVGDITLGGSAANRTVTVTPAANMSGQVTIALTVSDGSLTATDSFVLTINPVNDAPAFTPGSPVTVNEDCEAYSAAGWATDISAGPSDESSQALTFEVLSNDNPGLFSVQPGLSSNGTLTFTPAANANGVANLTVRLKDDGGAANGGCDTSATQSLRISLNAVNDAPTLTRIDGLSGATSDSPVTITYQALAAVADAADADNDPLSFRVISLTNGSLTQDDQAVTLGDADGVLLSSTSSPLVWTPPSGQTGLFNAFTVEAWDGQLNSNTAVSVMVDVVPTPSIVSISDVKLEGTAITVSGSATDPAGSNDTLSYSWAVIKDGVAFAADSGAGMTSYTFTPDDNGSYQITLTVSDEDGGSTSVAQTISVANVAPGPSIVSISDLQVEGTAITVTGSATDPAGSNDTLSYSWAVLKDGVAFAADSGVGMTSYTFTPDDNGSYQIALTVSDEDGGSTSVAQTISVANVAPGPSLVSISDVQVEGTAITVTGSATDPAGSNDTLSYSWAVLKDGVAFAADSGVGMTSYTFTPDDNGSYQITLTVSDEDGGSTSVAQTISVANVAPGPSIVSISDLQVEGTAITVTGNATDPAGSNDSLTYNWAVLKDGVAFAADSGVGMTSYTFTPDDNGSYQVALTVSDEDGGSASVAQTISVANVVPGPSIVSISDVKVEGTAITVTGSGTDPAGSNDTLSYSWAVLKDGVAFAADSGVGMTSYTFTPDDNGSYQIALTVSDEDGGSTSVAQTISVANLSPAPSIVSISDVKLEGTAITVSGSATDPAGSNDTLSYSWTVLKDGVAYAADSGVGMTSYTFTPDDNGSYQIALTVSDEDGGSTSVAQTISVANVVPGPSIVSISDVKLEGTAITVSGSATDPAGSNDTLSYSWAVLKDGVAFAADSGVDMTSYTFTPDDNGSYQIALTVSDEDGGSASVAQTISVANLSPAPSIVSISDVKVEGTAITVTGSATDPAGSNDTLSYSWAVLKDGVAFAADSGAGMTSYTFTPDDNGSYQIALTVSDEDGGSTSVAQTISVANVVPGPSIVSISDVKVEGTAITVSGSATDPAGVNDTLSYSWAVLKDGVAFAADSGVGMTSYTFTPDDNGSYRIALTVSDEDGGSTSVAQTISVANLSPAPSIVSISDVKVEGTAITVSGSATDPAGINDTLSYSWAVLKDGVAFAADSGVRLTSYSFTPDDNGSYQITLTVSDEDGGSTSVAQTISVANVAPGPSIVSISDLQVEGTAITVTGSATDPAGSNDTLSYSWAVLKDGVAFAADSGVGMTSYTFTPDDNGSYQIALTVSDEDGGSTSVAQTISVANVAPGPSLVSISDVQVEGTAITVTGSATDPAGSNDTLSYSWAVLKDGVAFAADSGVGMTSYTFTPDDNGSYQITLTVSDEDGGSTSVAQTISVANVAPGPSIVSISDLQVEGTAITVTGNATDPAGSNDSLTYNWAVLKDGVAFAADSGVGMTSYTFTPDDNGSYQVALTVSDEDGGSASVAQTISVANVVPGPSIVSISDVKVEGTAITVTGSGTDPAGSNDTLSYSWAVLKDGVAFAADSGVGMTSYTFTPDDNGSYQIALTVSDEDGGSTSVAQTISVANVAPAATIIGDVGSSPEGTPILLGSIVRDPGRLDTFTYAWHATASNGQVVADGHGSTFSLTPIDRGTYTVSLTVSDDGGGGDARSVSINVEEVGPNVDLTGSAATPEGSAYTLTLGPAVDPGIAGGDCVQTYYIHWGDSTADTVFNASAMPSNRQFTHTYADGSVPLGATTPTHTIRVDLLDNNGYWSDCGVKDIAVYNVAPTASLGGSGTVNEGSAGTVLFYNQSDASAADRASGYSYQCDFNNDGVFDTAVTTQASFTVPASFLKDGPRDVTVRGRIIDKDGGYTDLTRVIHVNNVAPVVNALPDATVGQGTLYTQSISFTDPGADTWTAQVSYGDGTGTYPLAVDAAHKTIALSHVYANESAAGNPYAVTVMVTDKDGGSSSRSCHVTAVHATLQAVATPNASGVDVTFNRAVDTGVLNLYQGHGDDLGPVDLTLVGANPSTGAIAGSLVWDAATHTAHFVKTGGVLAPDTYTLTLYSSANGWRDATAGHEMLDGDADGIAGGNYTMLFVVASSSARVLSLPDFARGPGQNMDVNARGTAAGQHLPVSISDGSGVYSVDFELDYDPTLVNGSGVNLAAGVPSDWGVTVNSPTAGRLLVTASGSSPLSAGPQDVIDLVAGVPSDSPYGASEVLRLCNVRINEGDIAALGDSAIHKVEYFGDATGDGTLTGLDSNLISRNVVSLDEGYDSAPLTDPVILTDVTGDGTLSGLDASFVAQKSVGLTVVGIPDPGPVPTSIAGVDPTVKIGNLGIISNRGDIVHTLVSITDDAAGLLSADFTISYNTALLDLATSDVTRSSYLMGLGWSMARNVNDATGIARISIYSTDASLPSGAPDLLNLDFHVPAGAPAGIASLSITGRLSEGQLLMTPVNGSIVIPIATTIAPDSGNTNCAGSPLGYSSSVFGQSGPVQYLWTVTRDGLSYPVGDNTNPAFDFTPSDTGTYVTSLSVIDIAGNTGSANQTGSVTRAAPNVPPVVTSSSGSTGYIEDAPPVAIDSGLAVTDTDSANLTGATVSITTGFQADQDVLEFVNQNGISGSYNSSTGVLILSGTSSVAHYQAALRSVQYCDSSEHPSAISRTIHFTATDGKDASSLAAKTVTITPVNDAPTISDVANRTINEDGSTGAIAFTVADAEAIPASLSIQTSSSNTTIVPTSGITLGGNGASRIVTVMPAANMNGQVTITLTVNDGSLTTSDSFVLTINPVNDAPSFTPGSHVTVNEDCGAYSAAGWATDISAGPSDESSQALTFEVLSNDNPGLFSVQPGLSSSGTLTFTPAANANGVANLTVRLKDDGGAANGGCDTSGSQSLRISIGGVNDAPTLTHIGELSGATSDSPFTITYETLAAVADAADADNDPVSFRVISLTSGSLAQDGQAVALSDANGVLLSSTSSPLVWTPPSGETGLLNAFTVKAWDGQLNSGTAVQVAVDVQPQVGAPSATLTITPSATSVSEPGGTATFRIARTGTTLSALAVSLDVSGTAERDTDYQLKVGDAVLTGTKVTIPAGAASVDVAMEVVDDWTYEEGETVSLGLARGSDYIVAVPADAVVTIADNELPVAIVESDGATRVTEDGANDTCQITLQTQPTANVVLTLKTDSQLRVTPTQLTFTPANWAQPQTVTVAAVGDNAIEGAHSGMIGLTAASSDPAFNGIKMPLTVEITDGATPDAVLSGHVYVDMNGNYAFDGADIAVPGVLVALAGTDVRGSVTAQVMSAADGSYRFQGLRAGTYQVTERQPTALSEGGGNTIPGIVLPAHGQTTNLDFRDGRLKPQLVSSNLLMASKLGTLTVVSREVVAAAESTAGNSGLADTIRQIGIPSIIVVNPQVSQVATGRPDLVASSDTGSSQDDNLTTLNNSSAAAKLSFAVGGVQAGASVRLYADGILIGQATAAGAAGATVSVTVTTNGVTVLADGRHHITATQTIGSQTSATSTSLVVTIDATPPRIIASTPSDELPGSVGSVAFAFSEAFDASTLTANDIELLDPNGETVPIDGITLLSEGKSFVVSVDAQTDLGDYLVTVQNVKDLAGNTMARYRSIGPLVR